MDDFSFPILEKIELRKGLFGFGVKTPQPTATEAVILDSPQGATVLVQGGPQLSGGELRKYQTAYRVSSANFEVGFECNDLRSAEEAFSFLTKIVLSCSAANYLQIIHHSQIDFRKKIKEKAIESLRPLSRNYKVIESADAEVAFRSRLAQLDCSSLGIRVVEAISVEVNLAADAKEHIRKAKETERAQELARVQQENKQKLEREAAIHQLELEQLKMTQYSTYIQQGNAGMLALMLAKNPADAEKVWQLMFTQSSRNQQHQLAMLVKALEKGNQKDWEIAKIIEDILRPERSGLAINPPDAKPSLSEPEVIDTSVHPATSEPKYDADGFEK